MKNLQYFIEAVTNMNKEFEAELLRKTLAEMKFNKSKTAEKLGISRTSLWRKLKEMETYEYQE